MITQENKRAPKNLTYEKAFNTILELFQYDKDKAMKWWMMPSIHLGNISPYQMVKMGRGAKLMKFIESAMDENRR